MVSGLALDESVYFDSDFKKAAMCDIFISISSYSSFVIDKEILNRSSPDNLCLN